MIIKAGIGDITSVVQMALRLWPDNTIDGLAEEFSKIISGEEAAVFIYLEEGKPAGFVQCQLRHDYVEGTDSSPVAYLEGIYVEPEFRHRGIAAQLLRTCEQWGRGMGCSEFASDCELDNTVSLAFHLNHGFEEVNRIICFKKKI